MTHAALRTFLEGRDIGQEVGRSRRVKNLIGDYGLVAIFVVCFVVLSATTSGFLTVDNLINVIEQSSIIGFLAIGLTFVMLTGGIDLSVGAVVGLAGVVSASFAQSAGAGGLLPLALGLTVGLLVGLVNSGLIIRGGVLPFLATLAVLTIARGLALIYSDGGPTTGLSNPFQVLGAGMIGPVPVLVVMFVAVVLVAEFVLRRTAFGRHVYAVGGNVESARTVGVSVNRVLLGVYLICGLLAGLAGVVLAARVNGADPMAGNGYELEAISAVVIGGTSFFGGSGSVRGTVLGVMLLGVVMNGLNLLDVTSYYQQVVQGLVLVLAVLLNRWKSG
ncbi:ABC transporter permease [Actinopolymorpha alba]|uniref:ABC transporter permease n=1 Tax=Actinopolymorpha alba TaxID=533267 RepID=UPI00037DE21A|nr:ABC transporter permease [Actinopolymorpha alba]